VRLAPTQFRLVGVIVAAQLSVPGVGVAQPARLSLEVAGGVNAPVGDAALVANGGAAVSIGLVHRLNHRFALITELQGADFDGGPLLERVGTTDIGILRWALGVDVSLLSPASAAWELHARFAGGISTIGTDPILDPDRPPRFFAKINDDALVLSGGIQIVASLGRLNPFVRVQPDIYFVGSNLEELQALNDEINESGVLIGIPVQVGLRVGF